MIKFALFTVCNTFYSLSVSGIDHIISMPKIFPLPLLRERFVGVFLYEGKVVPLYDLWKVFEADSFSSCRESQFAVLCSTEFGLIGIPADQVVRVVDSQRGEFVEADPEVKTAGIQQVFLCMGNRYPMLDIEALIASSYR